MKMWHKFGVRSLLVVGVVAVRLVRGIGGIWGNVFFGLGWVIGYFLTDIDDLFYAYTCESGDETCKRVRTHVEARDWRRAWELLVTTRSQRVKMPVHNVLTGIVVAVLGLWIISSSGHLLASGVVLGLTARLYAGFALEKNWQKWYWVFAREFSVQEHRMVVLAWGVLLLGQVISLVR